MGNVIDAGQVLLDLEALEQGLASGPAVLLDTRPTSEHLIQGQQVNIYAWKVEQVSNGPSMKSLNVERCRTVRLNRYGLWPRRNMGLRLRVWDYDGQTMLLIAEGVPAGMMPVAGHHGCRILASSYYAPGISSPGPRGLAKNFRNYG